MAVQDYTSTSTYRTPDGKRTAELDYQGETLTVFEGPTTLVTIPMDFKTLDEISLYELRQIVEAAEEVTETLDGHAVETVEAGELRDRDQVVFTSGPRTFFTPVTGDAFRTYYQHRTTGETIYGDWFLLIGGTRRYVAPGTTFKRAIDPAAVTRQKDQERRALQASLRNIR